MKKNINFDNLTISNKYGRAELAKYWGYDGIQGLQRGIVTPAKSNIVILFITKLNQKTTSKYNNYFDEKKGLLYIDGADKHSNDKRIVNAKEKNEKIYLFYRGEEREDFEFKGEVFLAGYTINKNSPSRFIFGINKFIANSISHIVAEESNEFESESDLETAINNNFKVETEGRKVYTKHVRYERSIKNRAKAIEIHGTKCSICSFDFNKVYGVDLAKDYIEVHHINPLNLNEGIVDPEKDLIPVCANCHRMLHRSRHNNITVEELKEKFE